MNTVRLGFRGDGVRGRRLVHSKAHCSSARWRAVVARMLPVRLASSFRVLGETRLGVLFFRPMVAGAASRRDDRGCEKAAGPGPASAGCLDGVLRSAEDNVSEHLVLVARDESTEGSFSYSSMRAGRRVTGARLLVSFS